MSSKSIPQGSTVLVTGAAGLIGAAVAEQLLKAGYNVKAATRSLEKAGPLKKRFDGEFGEHKFTLVHIEDFAKVGAYDEALKDVSGVIHVAGDVSLSPDHDKVVNSSVDGVLHLFNSIAKFPAIKRVVMTSSRIAIFNPNPGDDYKVDNNAFNDKFVQLSRDAPASNPAKALLAYAAGKTEAERAAWSWMRKEKRSFVLNTVLPDYVLGEIINPNSDGSTAVLVKKVATHSDTSGIETFVAPQASYYVDVRDVGRVHVAALVEPDVQNERLWAAAGPFSLNEVLRILRKQLPKKQIPADIESLGENTKIKIDNSRSTELLKRQGRDWVSLNDSIAELVADLK